MSTWGHSIVAAMTGLCVAGFGLAHAAEQPPAIQSLDAFVERVCPGREDPKRQGCEAAIRTIDGQLNRAFEAALWTLEDTKQLRAAQRAWLRTTRDACKDAKCAIQVMVERINELGFKTATGIQPRETPLTTKEARAACDAIGRLVTEGRLSQVRLRVPKLDAAQMTAAERASVAALQNLVEPDRAHVFALQLRRRQRVLFADIDTGGTCHSNEIRRVGSPEELMQQREEVPGDVNSFGTSEDLISMQGRYYVLSGYREPQNVAWITPDGSFEPRCSFAGTRREVIAAAHDRQICEAAARGQLQSISWEAEGYSAVLASRLTGAGPGGAVDTLERALVDIDNDGKPEWIARANWSSGAGCGSSGKYLVLLNANGSDVAADGTSNWPGNGEISGDESLEVYETGTARYVFGKGPQNNPVLYKLTLAGAEVECRFRDRRSYLPQ